jgi:glycosyltransferase involved in cell wall biosynthesis
MTVSHFCREDIIRRLHLPPEKVVVTPNAVSPIYQPIDREGQESVKNRWNLPERYILALGNLQPRKNIETLLRAWKAIMHKPGMENVSLVLTGKRAWLHDDILQEANQEGMERVLFTGYLPEKDLPALYSGAMMFVYPSLFEGFGLPPIEAMACGTPVIVGKNSALGETCGDAARYADVHSEGSLADAMVSLASDHLERERLAALGIARAAHFTLENLAEPTLRSWENILPQRMPSQR